MGEVDPLRTQRAAAGPLIEAELASAGFGDAHVIGRGGFGVVYRCTETALDRTVAVKVLTADFDADNRERFFREQQAMGRLTGQPNIVPVLQVGATESGRLFLVMPYFPRGSLEARIRRDGPLSVEQTLQLGVKMAGALAAVHRLGIVHRDITPANILFTDDGEPELTDFGIAHIPGGFQTATGTITGSPAFTAPEVLGGDPPSPASDVYGLGATLFAALTGHAAFERHSGEAVVAQFLRITSQPVPDLREHGIDAEVWAVVEQAMSRDPRQRQSATELGNTLRRLQARPRVPGDNITVPPDPVPDHPAGEHAPSAPSTPSPSQLGSGRPAARTSGAAGNLPQQLTSFVGRRIELAKVKSLLAASRLVTLTGIGGVGKTRLALHAAAKLRRGFTDGLWLAELGESGDDALVADVVAAALGLRDEAGPTPSELLIEHLATRKALLVLDNCERVIDGAAELAQTLLRTCPDLRILATSREALAIRGEAVLQVPPLAVPEPGRELSQKTAANNEALTLFADRAAAAVPGFELTADNTTTVAQICRQLDGLPLAIELAAVRLRVMSPEQLLQRLDDRYALLTHAARGTPTRQQTLRWCIDWSYDLCSPAEQQLWARLSIFAGSFELDAAEQLCRVEAGPDDLLELITALVDKSILIREQTNSTVRFRMLETLRIYGHEKLAPTGEYPELARRHASWYAALARRAESEWISPRQLDWIARLDREQPNLRAAMRFCLTDGGNRDEKTTIGLQIAVALLPYGVSRGMLDEGRYWLVRFLARSHGQPIVLRAEGLYAVTAVASLQGDLAAGSAAVAKGRSLTAQAPDPTARGWIAYADGLLALCSGDPSRARESLEAALEAFQAVQERTAQVGTLHLLGLTYGHLGDATKELACYDRVLELTESHGEVVYRAYTLWATAVALWRQGHRDRAVPLLEEGLHLTRQIHDPLTVTISLETLAWIASAEGNALRAATLMGAADGRGQSMGSASIFYPHLRGYHEECERASRRALGTRAFETARAKGRALDLDAAVSYALGEQPQPVTSAPDSGALTRRERQIAKLVAQGLTNKAIAARLVISPRTVDGHVEHILTKLGFTSRAQIAAWVGAEEGAERP